MRHPFLAAVAAGWQSHGIATLRYQFPYMERSSRRPDSPGTCHATVRAAVTEAAALTPAVPLFAGGKSFGGAHDLAGAGQRTCPRSADWSFWDFRCIRPDSPRNHAPST